MLSGKVRLELVNLVEVILGGRLLGYWCQESQKHFCLSDTLQDQYWNHQVI